MLLLEATAAVGLAVLVEAYLVGTRASLVYVAIVGFMAVWAAQAIAAYLDAVRGGARRGGAMAILALAPVAAAALTGFWLVGGRQASPPAALQEYVAAWRDGRPASATSLFSAPRSADDVARRWALDASYVTGRLLALEGRYGRQSGLDPADPFSSLMFEPAATASDLPRDRRLAAFEVRIVRRVADRGSFLGFPTAAHRTETVEHVGRAMLRLVAVPTPVPLLPPDEVWRIETLVIGSVAAAP